MNQATRAIRKFISDLQPRRVVPAGKYRLNIYLDSEAELNDPATVDAMSRLGIISAERQLTHVALTLAEPLAYQIHQGA